MFASLTLVAALTAAPSNDLTISNFRSGLACTRSTPAKDREGWICQPTELILITDQGDCVYDGKKELCTWHGFEFDYSASKPGMKLQCVTRSDIPADVGNPEGVEAKDTTSTSYEIELPQQTGHLYNPQYYVFQTHPLGKTDRIEETDCSHNGVVVFKMRFRFRFPTLPTTR